MLAPPRKRPRSPSPSPDEITSPLDIILKRRRQKNGYTQDTEDYISYIPQPSSPYDGTEAESSLAPWTRFVEKRRTRQWEKLNNPPRPASQASPSNDDYSSPIRPRMHSQPDYTKAPMSSSPVRHVPPSSSPFRPSAKPPQTIEDGIDEDMDEEEMRREWGEAYYSQNTLLRNLHMERANSHGMAEMTPDRNHYQTPSTSRAYNHPPSQPSHTPYRTDIPPSSPYFLGSVGRQQSGTAETPYRSGPSGLTPSSSPFPSQTMTQWSYDTLITPAKGTNGDDMMEELVDAEEKDSGMNNQYEATNRLLADLAVDRQRRWGA